MKDNAHGIALVIDILRESFPWITTIVISSFAAITQYAGKMRSGARWSIRGFLLDFVTCVFAGMLMHFVCEWQGIEGPARSFLVAITAHMGTRAMLQFEAIRDRFLGGVK